MKLDLDYHMRLSGMANNRSIALIALFVFICLDKEMGYPGSSRVSTIPVQSEPSLAAFAITGGTVPMTVKQAANGGFTVVPHTIKNIKEKEEERVEETAAPPPVLPFGEEKRVGNPPSMPPKVQGGAQAYGSGRKCRLHEGEVPVALLISQPPLPCTSSSPRCRSS